MMRLISLPSTCLLVLLYAAPVLAQRFHHRHAWRMPSFPDEVPSDIVSTGTAIASGYNVTKPSNSTHYTFKPYRTSPAISTQPTPDITLSFNPGGPEIPAPTTFATTTAQPIAYKLCNLSDDPHSSCEAHDVQLTSSCSTVLTGFFTTVSISDCSQSVTFASQTSFIPQTTTIAKAGIFGCPTTSLYVQSVVSYSIAPYQAIVADDTSDITVVVCIYAIDGTKTCSQSHESQDVQVNHVSVVSTSTFTTTVTVSEPFSSGAIMYYGDSLSLTLTSGHNDISTEHLITSLKAVSSTSESQIASPVPSSSNEGTWRTLDTCSPAAATSPAVTRALLDIDEKAAAIVYGPPPGGWGAISYPANAGANLASYPAPPGGWTAVSYPSDAGAGLSTYPAPSGGWEAISYPSNAGVNPPPMTASEPTTSSGGSPINVDPTPVSTSYSMITLTSTSTLHVTITSTCTVTPPLPTVMASLLPTKSMNSTSSSSEDEEGTTTITTTRTTTIIVHTVPVTQTIS